MNVLGKLPAIGACVGLIWLIIARVTGPSDLWHQTQSRTISYTTAMLVHGGTNWLLPVEQAEYPATKPPLYNWLAAPFVHVVGYGSELAHKAPSVVALVACWVLLVIVGRRMPPGDGDVGWLAALMFVSSYSVFKLGYLARPDMLLTFWVLLAWAVATRLLVDPIDSAWRRRGLAAVFWLALILAGLTKGPIAFLPIVFVLVAVIPLTGSLNRIARLGWFWGLGALLIIVGGWLALAWRIDPDHVRSELLGEQLVGRVMGWGTEGSGEGWWGWIEGLYVTPAYFMARFAPWSLAAVAGAVGLWWIDPSGPRVWRTFEPQTAGRMRSCVFMMVTVVAFFAIGASRRADYIVSAFGPGALLAAWWLLSLGNGMLARVGVPAVAVVVLITLTVHNELDHEAPSPDFSDGISSFIAEANDAMAQRPADLVCCWTGNGQLQAMLGVSHRPKLGAVRNRLDRPGSFWLLIGQPRSLRYAIDERLKEIQPDMELHRVAQSRTFPQFESWPAQVTLYWVDQSTP